ncbi:hypothetical protein SISSUDRAFT_1021506 [Sistotremastrum suecicum HHB10207 ss-3]|uniref:SNF2 family DNA-dependent ATPase n=1 Tax=Sistotremastrum suecicum HHB10207 ss-3 TaxID=1314776 RepID=A0A166DDJ9_9AGAM|nr:hypothetical protein SISSUDRAFT_1021506 [Sistotremastrum suecicum HHB10207 ss-3]
MSSSPSGMSSTFSHASTSASAASSPPATSPEDGTYDEEHAKMLADQLNDLPENEESRFVKLDALLERSFAYTKMIAEGITKEEESSRKRAKEARLKPSRSRPKGKGKGRGKGRSTRTATKAQMVIPDENEEERKAFVQPEEITGAQLRGYQLEGVAWMAGLWSNGLNGILADEMGLGIKQTIQTIAFIAHLRSQGVSKPNLIVCPLSVLHNWGDEFAKFAPTIPVCLYHGSPEARAEMRTTVLEPWVQQAKVEKAAEANPKKKRKINDEGEEEEDDEAEEEEKERLMDYPVIITTPEIIIRDTKHIGGLNWGYIVVDEGHRLKNFETKLFKEIKKYDSANRLILTGTPLHNNLSELWSLLNFILPDIFTDLDAFQAWFDLSASNASLTSHSSRIVTKLHAILKPFLLRRLKTDVEKDLPPKKEYVLYAPLSTQQKSIYEAVVNRTLRSYLISTISKKQKPVVDINEPRKTRGVKRKVVYDADESDDDYYSKLEKDRHDKAEESARSHRELGEEFARRNKVKQVNNQHLQNAVMQLRKVCSHPFLFDWPTDEKTNASVIDDQLVNASGKMMILDRLLDALFARGHKVLVFSQFKIMLDIIEEWAISFKGYRLCRIDGETKPLDRRSQMFDFQNGGDSPTAPHLFLLSTRAGGLGINLTAADTVIFFDSDWNPQMDLQAQDRAHRIGQKKPVLIYRLVTAHTVETTILQRAGAKRRLEALVIAKGQFRTPAAQAKKETVQEMAAELLRLEGEKIEVVPNTDAGKARVISDKDLDSLLDRSPEVFRDRGDGWSKKGEEQEEGQKAFEVFQLPRDTGNDGLAKMFGGDLEQ